MLKSINRVNLQNYKKNNKIIYRNLYSPNNLPDPSNDSLIFITIVSISIYMINKFY